jgi:hypothetical protein
MEDRCECGCLQIWSDRHHMLLCVHCDLGRKPKDKQDAVRPR